MLTLISVSNLVILRWPHHLLIDSQLLIIITGVTIIKYVSIWSSIGILAFYDHYRDTSHNVILSGMWHLALLMILATK